VDDWDSGPPCERQNVLRRANCSPRKAGEATHETLEREPSHRTKRNCPTTFVDITSCLRVIHQIHPLGCRRYSNNQCQATFGPTATHSDLVITVSIVFKKSCANYFPGQVIDALCQGCCTERARRLRQRACVSDRRLTRLVHTLVSQANVGQFN
jgi:hypothetical protein